MEWYQQLESDKSLASSTETTNNMGYENSKRSKQNRKRKYIKSGLTVLKDSENPRDLNQKKNQKKGGLMGGGRAFA